jgi:hypothetical protein
LRQGASVLACSAQDSSQIRLRKNEIYGCKHEENHRSASIEFKSSLFIADIQASLIQSSQKAYSAQIGDE